MPADHKHWVLSSLALTLWIVLIWISTTYPDQGIKIYYLKYDIKSSKNTITKDNLLMVPAKNEFRAESFSRFFYSGVISAAPGESIESTRKRIREDALKHILVQKGLQSVTSRDHDTVLSYEGVIRTPLTILKKAYIAEQNRYSYEIQVDFSPIAFPDRWRSLGIKHQIKEMVHDFFQLFK